jgi:hypothetical protein
MLRIPVASRWAFARWPPTTRQARCPFDPFRIQPEKSGAARIRSPADGLRPRASLSLDTARPVASRWAFARWPPFPWMLRIRSPAVGHSPAGLPFLGCCASGRQPLGLRPLASLSLDAARPVASRWAFARWPPFPWMLRVRSPAVGHSPAGLLPHGSPGAV